MATMIPVLAVRARETPAAASTWEVLILPLFGCELSEVVEGVGVPRRRESFVVEEFLESGPLWDEVRSGVGELDQCHSLMVLRVVPG